MKSARNKKILHLALVVFATIFFFGNFAHFAYAVDPTPTPTDDSYLSTFCRSGVPALNSPPCISFLKNHPDEVAKICNDSILPGASASPACLGNSIGTKVGGVIKALNCVADPVSCVQTVTVWWMSSMLAAAGYAIAGMAYLLNLLVTNLPTAPPDIIYSLWQFIRNFINLFFILILIVIAFATIFDIKKYNYQELLARLIIVALLINFSATIVQTVFTVGNQIASIELNTIQNSGSKGFETLTGQIVDGLQNKLTGLTKKSDNPNQTIGTTANLWISSFTGFYSLFFTSLFSLLFMLGMLLAFAYAALSFLIRIPLMWFLEIIAPLAFFAAILPSTRSHFKKWWTEVVSLAFAPTIFLFFMLIAASIFNARQSVVTSKSFPNIDNVQGLSDVGSLLKDLFSLNDLVFYVMSLAFLIGGVYVSRRLSKSMGSTTVAWANTAATKLTRTGGMMKGVTNTWDRVKKEGLPGGANKLYGGQAATDKRTAGVGMFLQKGMGYSVSSAEKARVSEEEKKLRIAVENLTSQEKEAYLRQKMQNGSKWEQKAAGNILNQDKKLRPEEVETFYNQLGGDHSEDARKFLKGVNFNGQGWDPYLRSQLLGRINDAESRGHIELAAAKGGDYNDMPEEELRQRATIFSSDEDKVKFLDQVDRSIAKSKEGEIRERKQAIDEQITELKEAEARLAQERKAGIDQQLEIAQAEIEERWKRKEITGIQAEKMKQDLETQAQKAKEEINAQSKERGKTLAKQASQQKKDVDTQMQMSNQAFRVKFSGGLIREMSGAIVGDVNKAIEVNAAKLGKVARDEDLSKMFDKIGKELEKRGEGKKPAGDKPEKPKKEEQLPKAAEPKNSPT